MGLRYFVEIERGRQDSGYVTLASNTEVISTVIILASSCMERIGGMEVTYSSGSSRGGDGEE